MISHTYKIQDVDNNLCGLIWLYFIHLKKETDYYNAVSKNLFSLPKNADKCF